MKVCNFWIENVNMKIFKKNRQETQKNFITKTLGSALK